MGENTIIRGSDKCYCFRVAVSAPVLAGSTPAPVPAPVDGNGLHYAAPSDFASSALALDAPPPLAAVADTAPALARVVLATLAAAPPDCFAGFDLVSCYHGNICFRSSVPVPVDSA